MTTTAKMQLTDAQFRILAAAAARGDNTITRGDASEATLRSLAARNIGRLQYETVGARQVVTSAYVTVTGWLIYTEEVNRREAAAKAEANARPQASHNSDPFAVHTQSAQNLRDAWIDAAFAV